MTAIMRCATYARFSTDMQHPASIDDQHLACERYAQRLGWMLLPDHRYVDEALSGMGVDHRPGYRGLLAALERPRPPFDVVLVDDLSRLSRDAAEVLRFVRQLQSVGVKLISVADGIETGSKLSKLAVSVKAVMNELYLDDLRDRTLRGLQGRFARGLHTGGRIYGYRAVPVVDPSGRVDGVGRPLVLGRELVIDSVEARIVQQIFGWFADGMTLRAIAHRLNAETVPFPAQPTKRGPKRKGWAGSAVRVILMNEKYVGRWVFGRRSFFKDPVSGRRRARLQPRDDWQVVEHPKLRVVSEEIWEAIQARFHRLAATYPRQPSAGRLAGRRSGNPSGRSALFSGLLRCGSCDGGMIIVAGSPREDHGRYGCGFHREKGPRVCSNGLTVKVRTVETQLAAAIQERVLQPAAVAYLVNVVNRHLEAFAAISDEERRRLEAELRQVEEELGNIEKAIVAGLVGETTAALLKERETRRRALKERLRALETRPAPRSVQVDAETMRARLENLYRLMSDNPDRVNAFFRQHLEPITCRPVQEGQRRFYRATGAAKGAEIIKSLGLAQAFDFGGCGGAQCSDSNCLGLAGST